MEPNKRTSHHREGLVPIRDTATELTRAASSPIQILTLTAMESNQSIASLICTLSNYITYLDPPIFIFILFFSGFVKLVGTSTKIKL